MVIMAFLSLAVAATIQYVTRQQPAGTGAASTGTSTTDLQAVNYARQTLDILRNSVSPLTGTGQHGEKLVAGNTDPLPTGTGSFSTTYGATRSYTVQDVGGATGYKKVSVTVDWTE